MPEHPVLVSRRAWLASTGIAALGLGLGACAQGQGGSSTAQSASTSTKAGGVLSQTGTAAAAADDPFRVLADDHRKIAAMLSQAASARDIATRTQMLEQLQEALLIHDVSEGMVIYPAMRQAGYQAKVTELNAEHADIKSYLFQLDQMPKDSPQWSATLRNLQQTIVEHVRDEEDRAFPQLRQAMSAGQLRTLAVSMQKARAEVA